MSSSSQPRWPILMHSPEWVNAFSFSKMIMLFVRLSLICGENPETCAQYMRSSCFSLTPLQLPMAEPHMCNLSQMLTQTRLHSSKTCMTIARAKLPVLITISLILPPPILTAIACHLHIIMDGHPCAHPFNTLYPCSCMPLSPSGFTQAFQ
jgi:hypothetical protein